MSAPSFPCNIAAVRDCRDGRTPSYSTKAAIGVIAGVASGLVSLPPDVAMVRMTLDGRLPIGQRRNYTNALEALYRIAKDEGFLTLWRVWFLLPPYKILNELCPFRAPKRP